MNTVNVTFVPDQIDFPHRRTIWFTSWTRLKNTNWVKIKIFPSPLSPIETIGNDATIKETSKDEDWMKVATSNDEDWMVVGNFFQC